MKKVLKIWVLAVQNTLGSGFSNCSVPSLLHCHVLPAQRLLCKLLSHSVSCCAQTGQ